MYVVLKPVSPSFEFFDRFFDICCHQPPVVRACFRIEPFNETRLHIVLDAVFCACYFFAVNSVLRYLFLHAEKCMEQFEI
jgi:hypothetical protein